MFNNTKNDSVNVIIRLYIEIVVLQGKHNINPRLKKKIKHIAKYIVASGIEPGTLDLQSNAL